MATPVQLGIDHVVGGRSPALSGRRVGLVTNDVATTGLRPGGDTRALTSGRLALLQANIQITTLFSPEHGLGSDAADGSEVGDALDPMTELPVLSLYGERVRPLPEQLHDLDAVLFDIPDVGARFYTYIWTLSHIMEACAEAGIPIWILDRPNPLGGLLEMAEGPLLDERAISSFVGRWSMPVRHSLTVGELAQLWNHERDLNLDLTVAPMQGWRRDMLWPLTGLPFLPASPNMPAFENALLYPGTCFFEGTNLSEGRGTSMPFRVVGAPWLEHRAVAERFNDLGLDGVLARAVYFTPSASKFSGHLCRGVMLHVVDPVALRPVSADLQLLAAIIDLHPDHFEWLPYPTQANVSGYGHFDRLIGRLDVRESLSAPTADRRRQIESWTGTDSWAARVAPHLLYT